MDALLWIVKIIGSIVIAALVITTAYRSSTWRPKAKSKCPLCGMPDWAMEEKCWYTDCPRFKKEEES